MGRNLGVLTASSAPKILVYRTLIWANDRDLTWPFCPPKGSRGCWELPPKQFQGNLALVKYDSGKAHIDISIVGVLTMMNIGDGPWLTFGEVFWGIFETSFQRGPHSLWYVAICWLSFPKCTPTPHNNYLIIWSRPPLVWRTEDFPWLSPLGLGLVGICVSCCIYTLVNIYMYSIRMYIICTLYVQYLYIWLINTHREWHGHLQNESSQRVKDVPLLSIHMIIWYMVYERKFPHDSVVFHPPDKKKHPK